MKLKVDQSYRVYVDHRIIRLTVLSDEGDGWYKVNSGGEVFFLNLNQVIKVYET